MSNSKPNSDSPVAPSFWRRSRKWLLILVCVAVVVALLLPILNRPPRPNGDKRDVAMFVASPDFQRMTAQQQSEYVQRVIEDPQAFADLARDKSLSPTAREHLLHSVSMVQLRQQAERFTTLPANQRRGFLDDVINDQERARSQMPPGAAPGRGDGQGVGKLSNDQVAGRIKGQIEHTAPEEMTRIAALMNAVNERRSERGLSGVGAAPDASTGQPETAVPSPR